LVTNLVKYERIKTTDAKAKEVRRYAERTITWGAQVAELVGREPDTLQDHERARIVHAMRMARRTVRDRETLHKLFHDIAPRYLGRPGGYTRIIKLGYRNGDAAPVSYIELLPAEQSKAESAPAPKGKGKKAEAAPTAKAAAKSARGGKAEAKGGSKASAAKTSSKAKKT
jgi:large subunit ribosomal protein L17